MLTTKIKNAVKYNNITDVTLLLSNDCSLLDNKIELIEMAIEYHYNDIFDLFFYHKDFNYLFKENEINFSYNYSIIEKTKQHKQINNVLSFSILEKNIYVVKKLFKEKQFTPNFNLDQYIYQSILVNNLDAYIFISSKKEFTENIDDFFSYYIIFIHNDFNVFKDFVEKGFNGVNIIKKNNHELSSLIIRKNLIPHFNYLLDKNLIVYKLEQLEIANYLNNQFFINLLWEKESIRNKLYKKNIKLYNNILINQTLNKVNNF